MEQSNKITKINDNQLSENRTVIVEVPQGTSDKAVSMLTEQMKEYMEVVTLKLEQHGSDIQKVQKTIETNYITPEELKALESLIDRKSRRFVNDKKGIQLNIDVLLNYDSEGLVEYQKLVNKEVGKTKSEIWVDLNKECLERKGTDPKNRIPSTRVDEVFDYVRTWGGFSI